MLNFPVFPPNPIQVQPYCSEPVLKTQQSCPAFRKTAEILGLFVRELSEASQQQISKNLNCFSATKIAILCKHCR